MVVGMNRMDKDAIELGRIAYDAYLKDSGGRSLIRGVKLPTFDELPHSVVRAWCAAGIEVALHQTRALQKRIKEDISWI